MAAKNVCVYLTLFKCTFKNDSGGKFYVVCILPQLKNRDMTERVSTGFKQQGLKRRDQIGFRM